MVTVQFVKVVWINLTRLSYVNSAPEHSHVLVIHNIKNVQVICKRNRLFQTKVSAYLSEAARVKLGCVTEMGIEECPIRATGKVPVRGSWAVCRYYCLNGLFV